MVRHFGQGNDEKRLKELITEALQMEMEEGFADRAEVKEALLRVDQSLNDVLAGEEKAPVFRIKKYPFYGVAAAVVLAFSFVFYQYRKEATPVSGGMEQADADPGMDKAVLTLADGRKVILDGTQEEAQLEDAGIAIIKTEDGQLIYQTDTSPGAPAAYNEIATPRGGQYRLVLSDGTKVWLNAASTLTYPLRFSESKREVKLSGEAYFDVKQQFAKAGGRLSGKKVPFIVKTAEQDVEVVGTQFNVSAYPEETATKTSLVEGSVRVLLRSPRVSRWLNPGQQAVASAGALHVQDVEIENEIAWKDGEFAFQNVSLADIMKHLSRWYDVDVDVRDVPQIRYTVFISRQVKLSNVLRMLEKTGDLQFRLGADNQLVINPKTEKLM